MALPHGNFEAFERVCFGSFKGSTRVPLRDLQGGPLKGSTRVPVRDLCEGPVRHLPGSLSGIYKGVL